MTIAEAIKSIEGIKSVEEEEEVINRIVNSKNYKEILSVFIEIGQENSAGRIHKLVIENASEAAVPFLGSEIVYKTIDIIAAHRKNN